jgi:hypothetical protein
MAQNVMAANRNGTLRGLEWFCMDILPLSLRFPIASNNCHWLNRKFVAAAVVSAWLSSARKAADIALGSVAELLQYLVHSTSPTIKTPSVSAANVRDEILGSV